MFQINIKFLSNRLLFVQLLIKIILLLLRDAVYLSLKDITKEIAYQKFAWISIKKYMYFQRESI